MQGLWREEGMRAWGHCFRQEVREGFSEEVTLSENGMISRRQIPEREQDGGGTEGGRLCDRE